MVAHADSLLREVGLMLLSLVAAILPAEDRARLARHYPLSLNGATLFLGVVQFLGGGVAWALGFFAFVGEYVDLIQAGLPAIAYVSTPTGILLEYVIVTGALRVMVVVSDRQAMGDPLVCLAVGGVRALRRELARRRRLERLGPERPDRIVQAAGADLTVLSCREKSDWNDLVTIQAGERFYRVRGVEERQDGPHRAVAYLLRETHANEVVRRLVRYEMPRTGK